MTKSELVSFHLRKAAFLAVLSGNVFVSQLLEVQAHLNSPMQGIGWLALNLCDVWEGNEKLSWTMDNACYSVAQDSLDMALAISKDLIGDDVWEITPNLIAAREQQL